MRKLLFNLFLCTLLIICFNNFVVADTDVFQKPSDAEIQANKEKFKKLKDEKKLLEELPYATPIPFNEELSALYNMPIYGGPRYFPLNETPPGGLGKQEVKIDKNGNEQFRYLGYSALGNILYNPWFPDDSPNPPRPMWDLEPGDEWVIWSPDYRPDNSYGKWYNFEYQLPNGKVIKNDLLYQEDPQIVEFFTPLGTLMSLKVQSLNASLKEVFEKEARWMEKGFVQKTDKPYKESTLYNNGFPADTMIDRIAVVSPRTEFTPFIMVMRHWGGSWYRTWTLPPLEAYPDLSIKITKTGFTSLDPNDPSKNEFEATAVVKVEDDTHWPTEFPNGPIKVYTAYSRNGEATRFPASVLTISKKGETQEFKFKWKADFGDEIHLWVAVNPPDPWPDGPRQMLESTYRNNIDEVYLQMNEKPAGPENMYKTFEYLYTPVPYPPIQINTGNDAHRIFTYKPNTITMETSIYTERIEIIFNKNYAVILENKNNTTSWKQVKKKYTDPFKRPINYSDSNLYEPIDYFYDVSVGVRKVTVNPYRDVTNPSPGYTLTKEEKKIWTFKFSLKNYTVYGQVSPTEDYHPIPNKTQIDTLIFIGYDHNNEMSKFDFEETNPLLYQVNVRQIKLFNLRITDVKDIHWKYVFNKADGKPKEYKTLQEDKPNEPPFGVTKMPLIKNPNSGNRLISKGYAVQFKIDSEGLYRSKDEITVKPTFWWYDGTTGKFREVDLYFDVPNQGLYNVPIELEPLKDGSNYKEKVIKHFENLGYTSIQLNQLKAKYEKNFVPQYSKFVVRPYNKLFEDKYLLEGRRSWEFSENDKNQDQITADQDNYFIRFKNYRNTWTFTYSIHPKVKAFLKGTDYDPFTSKPLTGAILVNFKIVTHNSIDDTRYLYTRYENNWYENLKDGNMKNKLKAITIDEGTEDEVKGKGNVFYFNLDWSVLDDYSMQQKW